MNGTDTIRIALFTDSNVLAGTERHILDLAHGLKECGVSVTIACPSKTPLERTAIHMSLPVMEIEKNGLVDWAAAIRLTRFLKSGEIDILHAHNGRTALAGALAVRGAGRGKLIVTQHFLEPNHVQLRGFRSAIFRMAHRWVTAQASKIVAISEAVLQAMIGRGDPSEKIEVIPNGITPPRVGAEGPAEVHSQTAYPAAAEVRRALDLAAEALLIVCVARLEPEKDIGSLIAAMELVHASAPEAVCVVAGSGSLFDSLQKMIRDMRLEGVVRLLGYRADAPGLTAASDLFVLPSLAEPFGLSILEAMALSIAVVTTRAGGPLEIVLEGETGLLVPPGRPDRLAQGILLLIGNPELRRRMGINGRARFLERYTADRMARSTLAVYREALGQSGVPAPHARTPHRAT